jgi:S-DNA-T family DNA segregation ATPase FtsK/SpoIIIE
VPQATQRKEPGSTLVAHLGRSVREGALYLFTALAAYLVVSLATYHANDLGWSYAGPVAGVANAGGRAGAWLADVLLSLFGYLAYLLPVVVWGSGWVLYRWRVGQRFDPLHFMLRVVGFVLALGSGAGLATLHVVAFSALPSSPGGILGEVVASALVSIFNFAGAGLFLLALFLTGITLFSGLSWLRLMDAVGALTLQGLSWLRCRLPELQARWRSIRQGSAGQGPPTDPAPQEERPKLKRAERIEPVFADPELPPLDQVDPIRADPPSSAPAPVRPAQRPPPAAPSGGEPWHVAMTLLDEPSRAKVGFSSLSLEEMSRKVETILKEFGIEVQVVAVQPGPVITRFELQPAPGLKASRVTNLSRDMARALSVTSVRVVEVIPGKSVIGLEIPNEHRELVRLSEILSSEVYQSARSPLTVALGKDVAGQPVVANLGRMPHLLVAGTTGSGKSVGINAMILSLVYNASPAEVRLILVDPKMLELSVYEGIPHLLAPVVTDMKEAANALRWCVGEMDRRYKLMAAVGVRNLAGYNRKIKDAAAAGAPLRDPFYQSFDGQALAPALEPLPFIVVVVDELADMMMLVGKKVEELIARLAQKARASGIHLILATQRPSVDVITGLIKANIPTRIAFQVSARVDSRTILDQMGAEQLLGQGDMLYLPPGTGLPVRVHGAFVADQEVHRVVEQLRALGAPDYLEEVLEEPAEAESGAASDEDLSDVEDDPLYDRAVRIVTETRRASISGVQRRLKIGYNRAARMIEAMESAGIVGAIQPNGSREVLAPPPVDG